VQGWRIEPEGPKPWPTVFLIHGGPTSVDLDSWSPLVQAIVDMGFQVAMLNYRGSIGFGAEWRDALIGNIGWPEVEDIVAGHDDLVARGIADPARSAIAGWSWGGYLTLLMQGMHPGRFISGVAGVPVADYVSAYADESPLLQAYDRALLGGEPADVPQLMTERSPIEYVDRVTAPLLITGGENDSRCPLPQILNYVERLKARNHPHELYLFATGHSSFDIDDASASWASSGLPRAHHPRRPTFPAAKAAAIRGAARAPLGAGRHQRQRSGIPSTKFWSRRTR
jgi:dipeptidyl aminopeptidase/acylaminoacyl peptidase